MDNKFRVAELLGKIIILVKKYADYLYLLPLAALPLLRVGINGIIGWNELQYPIFPRNELAELFWVWTPRLDITPHLANIPYFLIFSFFDWIGVPIPIAQRIWFVFILWLVAASMYFLTRTFFPKAPKIAPFVAAICYLYTPQLATYYLQSGVFMGLLHYGLIPLSLAILVRALDKSRGYLVDVGVLALVLTLLSVVWTREIAFYTLVFYATFNCVLERKKQLLIKSIKIFTVLISLLVTLNLWYLVPALSAFSTIYTQQALAPQKFGVSTLVALQQQVESTGTTIIDVIRLYFPYIDPFSSYYHSPLGVAISLLIPILAFLSLLLYRKKTVLFLVTLWILFVPLSSGVPGFILNVWAGLVDSLPFGRSFIPIQLSYFLLHGLPLTLSPLLGLSVAKIEEKLKRVGSKRFKISTKPLILFVILALIFTNSWPMLTGQSIKYYPITIPRYYYDAAAWIDAQPGAFNVLVLPSPSFQERTFYTWMPPDWIISEVTRNMLSDPAKHVIYNQPKVYTSIVALEAVRLVEAAIYQNQTQYVGKLLAMLNIKYILYRTDVRNPVYWSLNGLEYLKNEQIKSLLDAQKDLKLVKVFGSIYIYENLDYIPEIYAASRIISVKGNTTMMIPLLNVLPSVNGVAMFFLDQYPQAMQRKLIEDSSLVIVPNSLSNVSDIPDYKNVVYLFRSQLVGSFQINIPYEGYYRFEISGSNLTGAEQLLIDGKSAVGADFSSADRIIFESFFLSKGEHIIAPLRSTIYESKFPALENWKLIMLYPSNSRSRIYMDGGNLTISVSGVPNATAAWGFSIDPGINISADSYVVLRVRGTTNSGYQVGFYSPSKGWWTPLYVTFIKSESDWGYSIVRIGAATQITGVLLTARSLDGNNASASFSHLSIFSSFMNSNGVGVLYKLKNSNDNSTLESFLGTRQPSNFSTTLINPVEYSIQGSSSVPLYIVLNQFFHPSWVAKIISGRGSIEHILINGYMNGYSVNIGTNYYSIVIMFEERQLFVIGAAVSLATTSLLLTLMVARIRRGYKN